MAKHVTGHKFINPAKNTDLLKTESYVKQQELCEEYEILKVKK